MVGFATQKFLISLSFMVFGFHDILRKIVPTPGFLLVLLWFFFFYIKFLSHLEFICVACEVGNPAFFPPHSQSFQHHLLNDTCLIHWLQMLPRSYTAFEINFPSFLHSFVKYSLCVSTRAPCQVLGWAEMCFLHAKGREDRQEMVILQGRDT